MLAAGKPAGLDDLARVGQEGVYVRRCRDVQANNLRGRVATGCFINPLLMERW